MKFRIVLLINSILVLSIVSLFIYTCFQKRNPTRQTASLGPAVLFHSDPSVKKSIDLIKQKASDKKVALVSTLDISSTASDVDKINQTEKQIKLKLDLDEARNQLDPKTITWSQKLIEPKNLSEDVFLFFVQVAYEKNSESTSVLLNHSADFLNLDETFDDYIWQNLQKTETGIEQHVRNFVYLFNRKARPNSNLTDLANSDIAQFIKSPQHYNNEDLGNLRTIILSSSEQSMPVKIRILAGAGIL